MVLQKHSNLYRRNIVITLYFTSKAPSSINGLENFQADEISRKYKNKNLLAQGEDAPDRTGWVKRVLTPTPNARNNVYDKQVLAMQRKHMQVVLDCKNDPPSTDKKDNTWLAFLKPLSSLVPCVWFEKRKQKPKETKQQQTNKK